MVRQVRGWPAWKCVERAEGPSYPGTSTLSLVAPGTWLACLEMPPTTATQAHQPPPRPRLTHQGAATGRHMALVAIKGGAEDFRPTVEERARADQHLPTAQRTVR